MKFTPIKNLQLYGNLEIFGICPKVCGTQTVFCVIRFGHLDQTPESDSLHHQTMCLSRFLMNRDYLFIKLCRIECFSLRLTPRKSTSLVIIWNYTVLAPNSLSLDQRPFKPHWQYQGHSAQALLSGLVKRPIEIDILGQTGVLHHWNVVAKQILHTESTSPTAGERRHFDWLFSLTESKSESEK